MAVCCYVLLCAAVCSCVRLCRVVSCCVCPCSVVRCRGFLCVAEWGRMVVRGCVCVCVCVCCLVRLCLVLCVRVFLGYRVVCDCGWSWVGVHSHVRLCRFRFGGVHRYVGVHGVMGRVGYDVWCVLGMWRVGWCRCVWCVKCVYCRYVCYVRHVRRVWYVWYVWCVR